MSIFGKARCLDCRSDLPISVLYKFAKVSDRSNPTPIHWLRSDDSQLFRGKVGIECPRCGSRFAIIQWFTSLMRFSFLVSIGVAFIYLHYRNWITLDRTKSFVVAIVTTIVYFGTYSWSARQFARLRRIKPGEVVGFPLESIFHKKSSDVEKNDA